MSMELVTFSVRAWSGWLGGSPEKPGKEVPSLLRRRITSIGQKALSTAWDLPDLNKARYVFSSRHGEFNRTLSILESIAREEPLSPADFSLSVHHALVSLLSISQKNSLGHTAIASGEASFCFAFMESLACLAENPEEPVILIHCDEPLPHPYSVFNQQENEQIALALFLEKGEDYAFQTGVHDPKKEEAKSNVAAAHDFLHFLESDDLREAFFDHKSRFWSWSKNGLS